MTHKLFDFPREILIHTLITYDAETLEDLVHLSHVCKLFRQLILSTPFLFSKISLAPSLKRQKNYFNAFKGFYEQIACKDAILEMDLSQNDMIPLAFPLQILDDCIHLETLEMNRCRGFSFSDFMSTFRSWAGKRLSDMRKGMKAPLAIRFLDVDGIGPCFPELDGDRDNVLSHLDEELEHEEREGEEEEEDADPEEGDLENQPVRDASEQLEGLQRILRAAMTQHEDLSLESSNEQEVARLMMNARHHAYWFQSTDVVHLLMELQDLLNQLSGGIQVILKPSVCPKCKENTAYPPDIALGCLFCGKSIAWVCDGCEEDTYRICYPCAKKDQGYDTVACVSCSASQACPECSYWQCMKCTDPKNNGLCEACQQDAPQGQVSRRIQSL